MNNETLTSCIVHLADSANIEGVASNKRCNDLTGSCFESPNDTIHVTVTANAKKTTTVNKMNDINKMPTAHSGTFACSSTRATASQAKEPEFLPTHHKDIR